MEFSKRAWGWYLTFYAARMFKLKLLYFKSGFQCSFQRHFKRSETWCFLFGEGLMRINEHSANVRSGSSALVLEADWHQYRAKKPTLVLEVQTGICEESDIERAA